MKLAKNLALDWYLIAFAGLLIIIGLVTIYSLTLGSVDISLLYGQIRVAIFGLLLGLIMAFIGHRHYRSASPVLFMIGLLLLAAVLLVGTKTFGAQRWISLGTFQLQPSEPMKLFLILALARFLQSRQSKFRPTDFVLSLFIIGLPVILTLLEPDLGTALVLVAISFFMLLAAKISNRYWLAIAILSLFTLPIAYLNLEPYQLDRIKTFLSPASDPFGAGYNVLQSLIAVGNGGIFGQGFGQGTQSQLNFLPVAHTDFIFAGAAEAVGLVGAVIVLLIFTGLISRALVVGRRSTDDFGFFVSVGIAAMWFIQLTVNVGMNLGMAPVTGITLPFVSHGGSSLLVNLASVGILLSISRQSEFSARS
ncbi:rod shape-determining protein RodA [Candidatus Berkelbacteria bacterium]|nr:rod shape-determining protein RodA [Candidatus Berkelbacteria bacterium]